MTYVDCMFNKGLLHVQQGIRKTRDKQHHNGTKDLKEMQVESHQLVTVHEIKISGMVESPISRPRSSQEDCSKLIDNHVLS